MNVITHMAYGGDPGASWDRAERVIDDGVRGIRYETDYDVTALLHNFAVAGGLAAAWQMGNRNGAEWFAGMAVRLDGPRRTP